jgi:hypothetical protein
MQDESRARLFRFPDEIEGVREDLYGDVARGYAAANRIVNADSFALTIEFAMASFPRELDCSSLDYFLSEVNGKWEIYGLAVDDADMHGVFRFYQLEDSAVVT